MTFCNRKLFGGLKSNCVDIYVQIVGCRFGLTDD